MNAVDEERSQSKAPNSEENVVDQHSVITMAVEPVGQPGHQQEIRRASKVGQLPNFIAKISIVMSCYVHSTSTLLLSERQGERKLSHWKRIMPFPIEIVRALAGKHTLSICRVYAMAKKESCIPMVTMAVKASWYWSP